MSTVRRRMLHWSLVALAVVCTAGAAHAVVLKGRGGLAAAGNGFAVLVMRGGAQVQGAGLAVVDEDALVDVQGHGHITPLDDGRLLLEGFGRFEIRSPDERTRIEVAGARLRLRARGAGVAYLKGVGHFATGDLDGAWERDLELEFESESESEE